MSASLDDFLRQHVMVIPVTMPPKPAPAVPASPFDSEPVRQDKPAKRTVTFTWDLGPGVDRFGEPGVRQATLDCYHDKDRGRFVATLRPVMLRDGIASFMMMDFITITRVPVARFSAKALAGFASDALAALRARKSEAAIVTLLEAA